MIVQPVVPVDAPEKTKFESILISVLMRLYERSQSNAALFRLFAAHATAQLAQIYEGSSEDQRVQDVLDSHAKIDPESYEQLGKEYCRDAVIVAATLFDSFLTDVSRFLLLSRPAALPKDRQVKFSEVLHAGSISRLITNTVDKYSHELSYKSIAERILFLKEKFGVPVQQIDELIIKCEEIAQLRNRLVHVVSRYTYSVSDNAGAVGIVSQTLPAVSQDEADEYIRVTEECASQLTSLICLHVFGSPSSIVSVVSQTLTNSE